jgi:BirA family transcriptional regulator, biotin operon repressor / biotin---[acetyl-CoA-carboxylase] ligase
VSGGRGAAAGGAPGSGRAPPAAEMPWCLLVEESLPSTSDHLRGLAEAGAPDGLAVLARRQTAGRGRGGRAWTSPEGNLHLSVLLRPSGPAREAAQWSLLAGVALTEAAAALEPDPRILRLKWPNDLLRGGAKVAGILADASLAPGGGPETPLAWLVLGIGVNLAAAPALPDGRPTATLARAEAPEAFAAQLLASLGRWRAIQAEGGFAPVRDAWRARGPDPGAALTVRAAGGDGGWLRGRYAGLAEDGGLLLAPEDGQAGSVRRIAAGEIVGEEG